MANLFNELAIQTSLRAGLISELQATETRILELCGKMRPAGIPTSEQPTGGSVPAKRGRKPKIVALAESDSCAAIDRVDDEIEARDYRSPLERERNSVAEEVDPEPETSPACEPGLAIHPEGEHSPEAQADAKQNELIELLGAITLGIEMTTDNLLNIALGLKIIEDKTQPVAKRYVGGLVEQLLGSGHLRRQGGGPATRYVRVK